MTFPCFDCYHVIFSLTRDKDDKYIKINLFSFKFSPVISVSQLFYMESVTQMTSVVISLRLNSITFISLSGVFFCCCFERIDTLPLAVSFRHLKTWTVASVLTVNRLLHVCYKYLTPDTTRNQRLEKNVFHSIHQLNYHLFNSVLKTTHSWH